MGHNSNIAAAYLLFIDSPQGVSFPVLSLYAARDWFMRVIWKSCPGTLWPGQTRYFPGRHAYSDLRLGMAVCASTTYNSIRDGKRTRESIRICSVRFRLASAAQRGVRNYDLPFTVFDSSRLLQGVSKKIVACLIL